MVGSAAAHAAVGVGGGSLAAVSTVLPSTGGAIDLIVVRQPDGTLRCSPFYVRFGKYQGLIRGREKVVTVTVNGVLSDFTMQLGRSGEAFFVESVAAEAVLSLSTEELVNGEVLGDAEAEIEGLEGEASDAGGLEGEEGRLDGRVVGDHRLGALSDLVSPPRSCSDDEAVAETEFALPRGLLRSDAMADGDADRAQVHVVRDGTVDTTSTDAEWMERAEAAEGGEGEGCVAGAAPLTLDELRELAATHAGVAGDVTLDELREVAAILNTRHSDGAGVAEAAAEAADVGETHDSGDGDCSSDVVIEVGREPATDVMKDDQVASYHAALSAKEDNTGWGWLGWAGRSGSSGSAGAGGRARSGPASTAGATLGGASSPRSVASTASELGAASGGWWGGATSTAATKDIPVGPVAIPRNSGGGGDAGDAASTASGSALLGRGKRSQLSGSLESDEATTPGLGLGPGRGPGPSGLREGSGATFGTSGGRVGGGWGGLLLPRLELSLCGGDLSAFDDHRVDMEVGAHS